MPFSHEPKGTSLRIFADSKVVSGMDYGAVKLDHSLKRAQHVIHNEVRERECVARPGPAFMDTYLGRIGMSLPTLSFASLASLELNLQHTLPESEGALRVVGWKLDKGDGRAIHATTLAAVKASRFIGMAQNEKHAAAADYADALVGLLCCGLLARRHYHSQPAALQLQARISLLVSTIARETASIELGAVERGAPSAAQLACGHCHLQPPRPFRWWHVQYVTYAL